MTSDRAKRLPFAALIACAVIAAVAASIIVPRLRPEPTPLFEPRSSTLPAPDGWRRCFGSVQFTIAYPDDWSLAGADAMDRCRFADPSPALLAGDATGAAIRISTNETGDILPDARRPFTASNYPHTINALRDPDRWNLFGQRIVEVDGVPALIIDAQATGNGYYAPGTRYYAYVVAKDALSDDRCRRYFVHCYPLVAATRAGPGQAEMFVEAKSVLDRAMSTFRFYRPFGATRDVNIALACFFDSYIADPSAPRCANDGLRRRLAVVKPEVPVTRFTTQTEFRSKLGVRRMIVRTYRGSGVDERYSDDIFTLRGDERPYDAFDGRAEDWVVDAWERGREFVLNQGESLVVYLPTKTACDGWVEPREHTSRERWFEPDALRAVRRTVPADDASPAQAVSEVLMGPTAEERRMYPDLTSLTPRGVHAGGPFIKDGMATIGFGEDHFTDDRCSALLRELALSKTVRRFPAIKSVGFSVAIAN